MFFFFVYKEGRHRDIIGGGSGDGSGGGGCGSLQSSACSAVSI